jgi:hypothetical protein
MGSALTNDMFGTKLLDPRAFVSSSKMPRFGLSEEEAQAIAVVLLGNTDEKIPEENIVHPKQTAPFVPQGDSEKSSVRWPVSDATS